MRPSEIITLDFETYFDTNYTLKKLATTEYIKHEEFKIHGVGIKSKSWKRGYWFSESDALAALNDIDWKHSCLLCHHTHFDGLILSHHFGITPAYYLDTLSMARPIHGGAIGNSLNEVADYYGLGNKLPDILPATKGIRELDSELDAQLGLYCVRDVELTESLYSTLLPFYPDTELDLIHYTVNAYANPVVVVDIDLAQRVYEDEVNKREAIVASVPYTQKQLNSRDQFADILRELNVDPPMKTSPRTGKKTYAFSQADWDFQLLHNHPDQRVRDVMAARTNVSSSINEDRAARLLLHGEPTLPIYLNYGKAHTLRWTGGDKMNPQNFPRDGELRHALRAPEGFKFVIVDSAQIEARMNAWLAEEEELTQAFANGEDIYSKFAAEKIYYCDIEDIQKDHRFVGKVSVLGLGYQMGKDKFKYTLEIGALGPPVTLEEHMYGNIVYAYRDTFKKISEQWRLLDLVLEKMIRGETVDYRCLRIEGEKIYMPSGMYLNYPNIRKRAIVGRGGWETGQEEKIYNQNNKIYGGLLTENIVQALARNVVADQIRMVADKYRVVLMVHDEVILCVPEDDADQALKDTLEAFHTCPDWAEGLPVAGEGGITDYYQKM